MTYEEREAPTTIKLENGEYDFSIVKAEMEISKAGNDMIKLELSEKTTGAKVFDNLTFTEKAFFRIEHCLKSCGHKLDKKMEYDILPEAFLNRRLRAEIVLEKDTYNGKETERNRVQNYIGNNLKQPDDVTALKVYSDDEPEKKEDADAFGTTSGEDW